MPQPTTLTKTSSMFCSKTELTLKLEIKLARPLFISPHGTATTMLSRFYWRKEQTEKLRMKTGKRPSKLLFRMVTRTLLIFSRTMELPTDKPPNMEVSLVTMTL